MRKLLAMILAGGQGKRMDILCHTRPKPVLPFAGRFRVIDFSLSNCIHSGISELAVLTDYQRSHMADYLGHWSAVNGGQGGLSVLEPRNGGYKGTADAVLQNLGYLQAVEAEAVLVLAGDHVYKMDYRKMLAFHEQTNADVTVGVVRVPIEQAHRFGVIHTDPNGKVVDFVEKPKLPKSDLVSMGIYIFNKRVLSERLIEDAAQPGSPHDFGYAIIPRMVNRDRVFAYRFDGYWQDIGTVEAYYAANMELVSQRTSFSLDGSWPVLTDGGSLPAEEATLQTSLGNNLISPGCIIKGHVENSILSPGVWVDEKAVVRNSVIMPNVVIGYHSVVDRCVVDEGVNIGKFCYVGFGDSLARGGRDITVVGRGVSVPSHTALGRNCRVFPYVSQSDFTSSMVPSGAVVSQRAGAQSLPQKPAAKVGVCQAVRDN